MLSVGWFGFNVMSAQTLDKVSGLVAINSLMAMAGGTLAALVAGRNDPGFVHNGPLAGLVAVCAGSDVMHPVGALAWASWPAAFSSACSPDAEPLEDRRRAGRVAAARPVRRLGRHRRRNFRPKALGGMGGVASCRSWRAPLLGIAVALAGGCAGLWRAQGDASACGSTPEEEFNGADLSIHKITATPEREPSW